MARLPRVVVVGVAHHVTQRGNARQVVFDDAADRLTYLALLREHSRLASLSVLGYCLMSNHVHLIATPHRAEALAQTLKHTHGRYAAYRNVQDHSNGHVWQGRFYSCPLDDSHLWKALRYVELNPVRAGLVVTAEQWRWSSTRAHFAGCGDALLDMSAWQKRWSPDEWRRYLSNGEAPAEIESLRQYTHTGRPLGSAEFVADLERSTSRPLAARKGGRPRKLPTDPGSIVSESVA